MILKIATYVLFGILFLTASVGCNAPSGSSGPSTLLSEGCSAAASGYCTACNYGWALVGPRTEDVTPESPPLGKCEKCPANCESCADQHGIMVPNGSCTKCNSGGLKQLGAISTYDWSTGNLTVPYGSCEPCSDKNCQECGPNYLTCNHCNSPYTSVNGQCWECGQAISHCALCSDSCACGIFCSSSNAPIQNLCCAECEAGYSGSPIGFDFNGNSCDPNDPDAAGNECKSVGFYDCISCDTWFSGCTTCDSTGCTSCPQNGCAYCDSKQCTKCEPGYVIDGSPGSQFCSVPTN